MATPLTLTIGGVNFLPQYKTGTAKISSILYNQGDVLNFEITQKTGQSVPQDGAEVIFCDASRKLFGGYISKMTPVEYGVGQMIVWQVEVTDYTYVLINKFAQKTYDNQTLLYIVQDLVATNINSGYAITINNVATGPTIETVSFNHISLRECFQKLATITGYKWWVDYNKDIHFVQSVGTDESPESFKDSNPANHESVAISIDVTQVKNSIVVQGGTEESANYTQDIKADGEASEWLLLYPVKNMVSISVNGVSKTFGTDPSDSPDSFQFMYNASRGAIYKGTYTTKPASGDIITVVYTYEIDVIVIMDSATSISTMKAIEGGDGIHSASILDTTISSKTEARARAQQELVEYANPVVSGVVTTRTGLLTAGSYFNIGQALTVNMPSWGITQDTKFLIQKIETTLSESGSSVEYTYKITFGGKLLSIVDFLNSLAGATETPPKDTQVSQIHSITDEVSIAEVITKDSGKKDVSDSLTLIESVNKTNIIPPFKWGDNTVDSYDLGSDVFLAVGASYKTKVGQAITASGTELCSTKFKLKSNGIITGNAVVKVYAITGSYGTTAVPTGSALYTSNPIDVSVVDSVTANFFTFRFPTTCAVTNGTHYFISLEYAGGDGSNYLLIDIDNSTVSHSGNAAYYTSSWTAVASWDCHFVATGKTGRYGSAEWG